MSTQMNDPRELFLHELGDVLCAERTLVKTLPKLQEEASDDELAEGFGQHLEETRQQSRIWSRRSRPWVSRPRLRSARAWSHQEGARRVVSNESPSPEVLNAFLAGAGARTEHYEFAAYGGSSRWQRPWARVGSRI